MGIPLLPIMHEFCFPLATIFLKDKSDGVKIVPVIFVHEPHFMVRVEIVEDVFQGIIDTRRDVQKVDNVIVFGVTSKTT